MKVPDLLELAARNLRESVLRNSLTTVGVSVGVASLVAMLSLGIGLQQVANRQIMRSGLFDTIYVTSGGRGFGGPSGGTPRQSSQPSAPFRVLDESSRQEIARLKDVKEVYPDIRLMAQMRREDEPWKPQWQEPPKYEMISALPMSAKERDAFDGMKGSYFSSASANEAILQIDAAKLLQPDAPEKLIGREIVIRYPQRKALDQSSQGPAAANLAPDAQSALAGIGGGFSIMVQEQKLRVVGLIETKPEAGIRGPSSGGVYIPIEFAEQLHPMQMTEMRASSTAPLTGQSYSALLVNVSKSTRVEGVEDAIKKMGLNAFSLLDAARNMRRFFAVLDLLLGIFGSLALAVASLGIINTLVMSILERRREIGIMKAIGASDQDVRRLFFFEAGAMGLLGGSLGVLMGWILGRIINLGTQLYMARQQDITAPNVWAVPWWLVAGAIGFSIFVSLISGLYPATRAARLDPVQALRYE